MNKHKDPRPRELPAVVTYLAMEAPSSGHAPPAPLLKSALLRCENPPVHFYRYLYNTIGESYFWVERRLWSDEKLKTHLQEDKVALYALYLNGVPGGMAEIDFREPGIAQISYFGLTREFTGRRIGPWFLHLVIEICWSQHVKRVLVNTCTLDHRKALVTYQRAGFAAYARSERVVVLPRDFPGQ
jgi:GNAT superfamily N-acetyltransferase